MGPCTHLQATLAATVILVTPVLATAGVSDVFSPGPRLDLAVELDYRSRYLSVDDLERDAPPPDWLGRERLGDAKARVTREYARMMADRLVGELVESVPLFAELGRHYDRLTTFRFARHETAGAGRASDSGDEPPDGPAAPLTVRLRLNVGLDRIAPAVEATRGPLRGRLAFEASREQLELTLAGPIWKSLGLELSGAESLGGGSRLRLAVTLPF